jgi:hypothetical protein
LANRRTATRRNPQSRSVKDYGSLHSCTLASATLRRHSKG